MTGTFRESLEFALALCDLGKVNNGVDLFQHMKDESRYEVTHERWVAYGRPRISDSTWGHFAYSVDLFYKSLAAAESAR